MNLEIPDGPKTILMWEGLKALTEYEESSGTCVYNNLPYTILTSHFHAFTQTPIACVGSHPLEREIILLDPQNAPILESKYQEWKQELSPLTRFICSLFESSSYVSNERFISLDNFLSAKNGVCRHTSLVTAYFLTRMSEDQLICPGKAYYVRDLIPHGGHAWNLYITDTGEMWHIDSSWNLVKNPRKEEHYQELIHLYGKKAIDRELLFIR